MLRYWKTRESDGFAEYSYSFEGGGAPGLARVDLSTGLPELIAPAENDGALWGARHLLMELHKMCEQSELRDKGILAWY